MSRVTSLAKWLLGAVAVATAAAMIVIVVIVPRATGGAVLTVLTGSMTPAIPAGSVVLVVPTDPMTIEPGDIITYQTAPGIATYVTHRVVGVEGDAASRTFVTKGDANRVEDREPVPAGAVRGEVRLAIPYIGKVATWVRSRSGMAILALLLASWGTVAWLRGRAEEQTTVATSDTQPEGQARAPQPAPTEQRHGGIVARVAALRTRAMNHHEHDARSTPATQQPEGLTNMLMRPLAGNSIEDHFDGDDPGGSWLIEGVLPAGITVLGGSHGSGKSLLAQDWALSLGAGIPWLGHEVRQMSTVYVSPGSGRSLARRQRGWRVARTASASNVTYVTHVIDPSEPEALAALSEVVLEAGAGLVVLDGWGEWLNDRAGAPEGSHAASALLRFCATHRCSALVIPSHCMSAGSADQGTLNRWADAQLRLGGDWPRPVLQCNQLRDEAVWAPLALLAVSSAQSVVLDRSDRPEGTSVPMAAGQGSNGHDARFATGQAAWVREADGVATR